MNLLEDMRRLFQSRGVTRLPSDEVVTALTAMEERPWPEWRQGKAITKPQVAKLLRGFGIKPKVVRIGHNTPRGYKVKDFRDAWARYLVPVASEVSATSETSPQATLS